MRELSKTGGCLFSARLLKVFPILLINATMTVCKQSNFQKFLVNLFKTELQFNSLLIDNIRFCFKNLRYC